MKKQFIIFTSLIVCIFLLFGCNPAPTTSTAATSATAAKPTAATTPAVPVSVLGGPQGSPTPGLVPQYGGTLKIIQNNTVTNLGAPWKVMAGFERPLSRFAIENLVGLDTKGIPIPQLATSWVEDIANKTITFTLRQGVNFHDGTTFDATSAKWCLDKYRSGTLSELKIVTSVDVIDSNHLKLTLSAWDPLFLSTLSSAGAGRMVSPTAAQKLIDAGKENDIAINPVGTGPFKIVSFVPQVSFKYARWDGYWQKGLPYLDAVEVNIVADSMVALTSFIRGEANFIGGLTTSDAKKLKDQGNTVVYNISNIWGLGPDSKNPSSPLSDIRVRQAIAYAINKDFDVNSVFEGLKPLTNQLAAPGKTGYDSTIKGYPYDPAKAQELLGLAGYSAAKPLTVKISYTSNQQQTDLYTVIQSDLKKAGINLTLESLDNATTTKMISSGWNNGFTEFRLSYNGLELKYSTGLMMNLAPGAARYVSITIPDEYTTLYNTMMAENDLTKREVLYQKLNKMAVDTYCMVIPLYVNANASILTPNVIDFGMSNGTVAEFLPERAWFKK